MYFLDIMQYYILISVSIDTLESCVVHHYIAFWKKEEPCSEQRWAMREHYILIHLVANHIKCPLEAFLNPSSLISC